MVRTNTMVVALCLLVGAGCGSGPDSSNSGGAGGSGGTDSTGGAGGSGGTDSTGGAGGAGGTGGLQGTGGTGGTGGSGGTGGTPGRVCGDGIQAGNEACDGADLAGATCVDRGFDSGTLDCASDCTFDESGCTTDEVCDNEIDDDGNGAIDCDDDACTSDIVACPSCGDGVINAEGEACDGATLPSCGDLGFDGGTTSCTDACTIDSSACVMREDCTTPGDEDGNGLADCDDPACADHFECPTCGNGIIQQGEMCEGTPPPQASCEGNGFDTGTVSCDSVTCTISVTNCRNFSCGDGQVEGPEECEDGNSVSGDGCTDCMRDGDTCMLPTNLSALWDATANKWIWNGDTTTFADNFADPSCSETFNQPDAVASFTPTAAGNYHVVVSSNFDVVVWAQRGACGTPGTQLDCSDDSGTTGTEELMLRLSANETVHIFVSGYGTSSDSLARSGTFTISASLVPCGNGVIDRGEFCDDGNTAAGDGCSATCMVEGTILEVEPNESRSDATPLPVGSIGVGEMDGWPDGWDYWSIDAVGGTTYQIKTSTAIDGTCGTAWTDDTWLGVFEAVGNTPLASNLNISSTNYCSAVVWTAPATATYYIDVETEGGDPIPIYFLWVNQL